MYIEPVTEEEILQLVNNAKRKISKGHDGLDMCPVKKIIPILLHHSIIFSTPYYRKGYSQIV